METKIVPGLDTNKVLELLDELKPPRQQKGDVTIAEAMDSWGISKHLTTKRLDEFAQGGKFTKLEVILINNKPGIVYRPVP